MMPYSFQPPLYSSTSTGSENVPNVGTIEFPGFSTQTTHEGINGVHEITPNPEDSTTTRRKNPKWTTTQNLVLLGGWIKYETDIVVGRNQKSESYWGNIVEYCKWTYWSFVQESL